MTFNQAHEGAALVPALSVGTKIEGVLVQGDLSKLTAEERVAYYYKLCKSLGLNPLTRPLEYLVLSGRLVLYARKDATEQLRKLHGVSIIDVTTTRLEDVFVVTAKATDAAGRTDVATGAVSLAGLRGEALANALMKAETKSKRRVTLSICGLGMLDESELESVEAEPLPAPTLPSPPSKAPTITTAQAKRLWTIAKKAGWTEDEVKALYQKHGFEHSREITRDAYDTLVYELEGGTDKAPEPQP